MAKTHPVRPLYKQSIQYSRIGARMNLVFADGKRDAWERRTPPCVLTVACRGRPLGGDLKPEGGRGIVPVAV